MTRLTAAFLAVFLCAESADAQFLMPGDRAKSKPIWNPGINQQSHSTYYDTPYINRLADRVFMGAMVKNNGKLFPYTTAGDWQSALGLNVDNNYAQVAILADPNVSALFSAPQVGLLTAIESVNYTSAGTPRGFEPVCFSNSTVGAGIWCQYSETWVTSASAGNAYGTEWEGITKVAATIWDPYTTTGSGLIGYEFGCGGGQAGTNNCTVGMYFAANPSAFNTGIIVFPGAIAATGPGGIKPFLSLPYDNYIAWFKSSGVVGADIVSDATGNLNINTNGGTLVLSGNSISRGQFPGTATNDNAAAGYIGEYQSQTVVAGSAVALTTSVAATVVSKSLTAGDWDVTCNMNFQVASGNPVVNLEVASPSATTNTLCSAPCEGYNEVQYNTGGAGPGQNTAFVAGPQRFSLSGTTTVYCVAEAIYSTGSISAFGMLRARRMR